jgi:hypothetical protein
VIGQCCNFQCINSTVEISWDIYKILADYCLRHLVNNVAILWDYYMTFSISALVLAPRLPYQARQRSWSADMGRGLIPGTIWKISRHNLFITYLIAKSQCWLFALRANTKQISVFGLKYPYLSPNSTSGVCAVVSNYKERWCIKICI